MNYWNDRLAADRLDNDGDGAIDEADEVTEDLVNDTLDELIASLT